MSAPVLVPFYGAIRDLDNEALLACWANAPALDDPRAGLVSGAEAFTRWVQTTRGWLEHAGQHWRRVPIQPKKNFFFFFSILFFRPGGRGGPPPPPGGPPPRGGGVFFFFKPPPPPPPPLGGFFFPPGEGGSLGGRRAPRMCTGARRLCVASTRSSLPTAGASLSGGAPSPMTGSHVQSSTRASSGVRHPSLRKAELPSTSEEPVASWRSAASTTTSHRRPRATALRSAISRRDGSILALRAGRRAPPYASSLANEVHCCAGFTRGWVDRRPP